jgi:hypothetical protein
MVVRLVIDALSDRVAGLSGAVGGLLAPEGDEAPAA